MVYLLVLPYVTQGQIGGNHTYDFLNLTNSGRVAALGGVVISSNDHDLNLVYHNPGLLNAGMDQNLVLNYVNYFSDINFGYFSYARNFQNIGSFAAGIHYINYGRFTGADETGVITGSFTASEYAIHLSYSRPFLDSMLQAGITLKPIISNFERYHSFGLAIDMGIHYLSRQGYFSAGLVVKNLGTQIKPYYKGHYERLPFEIQLGLSQKLKHAPLRFLLNIHHLETFDLAGDPQPSNTDGSPAISAENENSGFKRFGNNFLRHFIVGLEFNPFQPFFVRAGFNYNRRQELKVPSRTSTIGLSWGLGLNLSKFHLSYGRARYHLAGASNHISITLDLGEFQKKLP